MALVMFGRGRSGRLSNGEITGFDVGRAAKVDFAGVLSTKQTRSANWRSGFVGLGGALHMPLPIVQERARRRIRPRPANAAPNSASDAGSGVWVGRPGVFRVSEQLIVLVVCNAVWVQLSDSDAVWPRNGVPGVVSPVTVPLNCSEMLPCVVCVVAIFDTAETLVR